MSLKLFEYIDLMKRGIENYDKVAEGVINQVKLKFHKLPKDEQEEIAKRKLICRQCPFYSLNAKKDGSEYKKLMGEDFKYDSVRFNYCGICGCPEDTRTASFSSECGLSHYNDLYPENKQELKWKAYIK